MIEAVSAHVVEVAARALLSNSVSYATAQGLSTLGLAGEAGITGEWLRLSPQGFSGTATQGLLDLQTTITGAMGLDAAAASLVAMPIMVVFFFGQRYFTRGLLAGAVKG